MWWRERDGGGRAHARDKEYHCLVAVSGSSSLGATTGGPPFVPFLFFFCSTAKGVSEKECRLFVVHGMNLPPHAPQVSTITIKLL